MSQPQLIKREFEAWKADRFKHVAQKPWRAGWMAAAIKLLVQA